MLFLKKGTYSITALSVVLGLFAVSLCTELRVPIGTLNMSVAELLLPLFAPVLWFRRNKGRDPMPGTMAMLFIVAITVLPIFISGDLKNGIPAARSIILPSIFIFLMYLAKPTPQEGIFAIFIFACAAVAVSILSIAQAELGTQKVFNLYTAHLINDVTLKDVMDWKLGRSQGSEFLPGQKSIATGLDIFSNNLGEYLVYALVAVMTLLLAKAIDMIKAGVAIALILGALVASLSRTSWIGAVVILILLGVIYMRGLYWKSIFAMICTLSIGGVYGFMVAAIQFDRGQTVVGRDELNATGMYVYFAAPIQKLIIGGSGAEYWSMAGTVSYPHNTFIFDLVYFGVIGALTTAVIMGAVFIVNIAGVVKNQRDTEWALYAGALGAISWLFIYGLTWAPLANSNSLFMCGLFCSLAAANYAKVKIRFRRARPRSVDFNGRGTWQAKPLQSQHRTPAE